MVRSTDNSSTPAQFPPHIKLKPGLHLQAIDNGRSVLLDKDRDRYFRLGAAESVFVGSLLHDETSYRAMDLACAHDPSFQHESAVMLVGWLERARLTCTTDCVEANEGSAAGRFSPLFFKLPLCNPDAVCRWLHLKAGLLWSPLTLCAGVLFFVVVSALLLSGRWNEILESCRNIYTPWRGATLCLSWLGLKLIHETAHGVVCCRYGGKVEEAGIAVMMLMPTAYIDTSSSWQFPSRWMRLHVTLAGVASELWIAGVALVVWHCADSASYKVVAADLFLMASVSACLFNLNPLLRFDGYFALADVTGVDNLYVYGQQYVRYFVLRWILGVDMRVPPLPESSQVFCKLYGLLASAYRVIAIPGILGTLGAFLGGWGVLAAIWGVVAIVLIPLGGIAKYLIELHAEGSLRIVRLLTRVGVMCSLFGVLIFHSPLQLSTVVPGVVEYDPPIVVRTFASGFVAEIHANTGSFVNEGGPILTLRNEQLLLQRNHLGRKLSRIEQELQAVRWRNDSSGIATIAAERTALLEQIEELQAEVESLTINAPASGFVISTDLNRLLGTHLEPGTELALIGCEQSKRLRISLLPGNAQNLVTDHSVSARIIAPGLAVMYGNLTHVEARATTIPSNAAVLSVHGGPLLAVGQEDGAMLLAEPRLDGYISLSVSQSKRLRVGQLVIVGLPCTKSTIGVELVSWLRHRLSQTDLVPPVAATNPRGKGGDVLALSVQ